MPSPTSFEEFWNTPGEHWEMCDHPPSKEFSLVLWNASRNATLKEAAGICRETGAMVMTQPTIDSQNVKAGCDMCAQAIEARVTSTDPPPSPAYLSDGRRT